MRRVLVQIAVLGNRARKGDIMTWQELGFSSEAKLDGFIAAGYGTEIFDSVFDPTGPDPRITAPPPPPLRDNETGSTSKRGRRGVSDDQPSGS